MVYNFIQVHRSWPYFMVKQENLSMSLYKSEFARSTFL